jgi:hypothetical protein
VELLKHPEKRSKIEKAISTEKLGPVFELIEKHFK